MTFPAPSPPPGSLRKSPGGIRSTPALSVWPKSSCFQEMRAAFPAALDHNRWSFCLPFPLDHALPRTEHAGAALWTPRAQAPLLTPQPAGCVTLATDRGFPGPFLVSWRADKERQRSGGILGTGTQAKDGGGRGGGEAGRAGLAPARHVSLPGPRLCARSAPAAAAAPLTGFHPASSASARPSARLR